MDFVQDEPLVKKLGGTGAGTEAGAGGKLEAAAAESAEQPMTTTTKKKGNKKQLDEFMEVMKGSDANALPINDGGKNGKKKRERVGSSAEPSAAVEESQAKEEIEEEELDDLEWLKRRQTARVVEDGEEAQGAGGNNDNETDAPLVIKSAADALRSPEETQILATGRLFIRNLAFSVTPSALRSQFSNFGEVLEVHVPVSKLTKEPLGTAFVLYKEPREAVEAWKHLDKKTFMGRLLHVLPGRAKPGASADSGVAGVESGTGAGAGVVDGKVLGKVDKRNIKAEVDARRRNESNKGLNWATLYMNSDAVASSVAARMGIQKGDILNADAARDLDEGDDATGKLGGLGSAVKLALAETSVIAETKKYFEEHGVVLDRLTETSDGQQQRVGGGTTPTPRTIRSKTTLLVKNIPYGTTIDVLTALFSPHGSLKRVLMPPAGTLAVVEFEDADDASKAFKAVAYRRLGNAVIYLEKAPEGLLTEGRSAVKGDDGSSSAEGVASLVANATVDDSTIAAVGGEAGTTLYIRNLSFATTNDKLTSVFQSLPDFAFARVATKPDPKDATKKARLSMGFGFVGFKTKEAAAKALKGLKGFKLDGHELEFKFAQRGADEDDVEKRKDAAGGGGGSSKNKSTKITVKNLPFEVSKKDVADLFSAYGKLKSVRIPKKHNGTGRGFAFCDFMSRSEAEAAMTALKHTHLLGRHLILQWSEEEEDKEKEIQKLRQKTKGAFVGEGGEGLPVKKRKLNMRDGLVPAMAMDLDDE